MVDQCKHCLVHGNMEACKETECQQHENWYAQEIQTELTRTRSALEGLKREVREALHPLHWELASGQEMPNSTVRFRLSDALDRAEKVEKGD
jgi:hypothetical protein